MVCNFIGDQWFIEKVVARHSLDIKQRHINWNMVYSLFAL